MCSRSSLHLYAQPFFATFCSLATAAWPTGIPVPYDFPSLPNSAVTYSGTPSGGYAVYVHPTNGITLRYEWTSDYVTSFNGTTYVNSSLTILKRTATATSGGGLLRVSGFKDELISTHSSNNSFQEVTCFKAEYGEVAVKGPQNFDVYIETASAKIGIKSLTLGTTQNKADIYSESRDQPTVVTVGGTQTLHWNTEKATYHFTEVPVTGTWSCARHLERNFTTAANIMSNETGTFTTSAGQGTSTTPITIALQRDHFFNLMGIFSISNPDTHVASFTDDFPPTNWSTETWDWSSGPR